MKWYWYITCGLLIILGIFATIDVVEMFSVASKEYGTVITIETENNYEEISKFDFGLYSASFSLIRLMSSSLCLPILILSK